jgi:hypothetical protein
MRYIHLTSSELRKQITASPVICEGPTKRGAGFIYPVQFVDDNAAIVELEPSLTSGLLVVGKKYVITTFNAGDDFTNVGAASNASGTVFTATGTTPTTWSHSSVLDGGVVTIGFKAPAGYDSVAFTVGPFTAVKTGSGTSTVYTFTLSFLTALLDQLLATNLDDVELVPEIKWESTLYNGETLSFTWIVQNNVNRGGEQVSAYPVTDTVLDLTQVTRLVGGVYPTDLDAQLLAGFPNGKKFSVVVDISGDGILGERRYQKRAGTEVVSASPDFILCLDGTRLYIMA